MLPESAATAPPAMAVGPWTAALIRLAAAWAILFILTLAEWRGMAHQWWNIDTYGHVVLIPPILGWLVWLRREQLVTAVPIAWWPGLGVVLLGLTAWLVGRTEGVNLVAQCGTVLMAGGAVVTLLGLQAAIILVFPLGYSAFLVPFGDEIVPPLQNVTANIAVALTHWSGVPALHQQLFIDTPAGRFVVAEECSGVKFLVAMVALSTLVAGTSSSSWRRRIAFVIGAATVSILANGIRAWGTIYIAQFIGAERAGGFDHIVYGWVFFAIIVAFVLSVAWRYLDHGLREGGVSSARAEAVANRWSARTIAPDAGLFAIGIAAIGFAVIARVV